MRTDKNETANTTTVRNGKPILDLVLWPNRSLNKRSHVRLVGLLLIVIMIPVGPFLNGSSSLIIFSFSALTILFLYYCLSINLKHGKLYESVKITNSSIEIKHVDIDGTEKVWQANPYWVSTKIYRTNQKVENYLTLKGNGREIELGSFLAPEERLQIKKKIDNAIHKI